jgi:cytochrome b561
VSQKTVFNKTRIKLYLDIVLIAVYVILMEPHFTGETWHEWIGLAIGGAIIIHLVLNWKWVVKVTQRFFFGKLKSKTRISYLLNLGLFISFMTIILSGIIISHNLNTIEALGLDRQVQGTWKQVHSWAAGVVLLLVGAHLGLHWRWIVTSSKRYLLHLRPSSDLAA